MSQPGYWELHEAACQRGDHTYVDPETGFMVFTSLGLLHRERCCGAACRHCPYNHENVAPALRAKRIQQAAWLGEARPDGNAACSVLFWSGGKDSYLAYRALQRAAITDLILLTTFDANSRIIEHQEIAIDVIVEQAAHLGAPLIGVPMHADAEYTDQIGAALQLVPGCERLCFGDLHLEPIRDWRVKAFAADHRTRNLNLSFPLWRADYETLLDDLEASGAIATISAIATELPGMALEQRFDRDWVAALPGDVDPFGENGEFHTRMHFEAQDNPARA